MKKLGLILLIAVLASVLLGCGPVPVPIANINGHGTVVLLDGDLAGGSFVPGEATFSLSFACNAQNNNRMQGYLNWYDPANGVRISATLPETSVKVFTGGVFTTCKAMKAAASTMEFSVDVAGIYSENGNADGDAGTLTGAVLILVSQPGEVPQCVATGTGITVFVETQQGIQYTADGCLDRGKIIFGSGGQNQQ